MANYDILGLDMQEPTEGTGRKNVVRDVKLLAKVVENYDVVHVK